MMANAKRITEALVASSFCGAAMTASGDEDNSFEVTNVLTEKAAATLAAKREGMVLSVEYYGWPKPDAQLYADAIGQIGFGPDRVIGVPGKSGTYQVPNAKLDPKRLGWLDGPVQVNVNIASARLSNDDNLLDCQVIDMPLVEARRAPNTLRCGLIYGDQESPSNG